MGSHDGGGGLQLGRSWFGCFCRRCHGNGGIKQTQQISTVSSEERRTHEGVGERGREGGREGGRGRKVLKEGAGREKAKGGMGGIPGAGHCLLLGGHCWGATNILLGGREAVLTNLHVC